jgi:iron complex transport system permease protein
MPGKVRHPSVHGLTWQRLLAGLGISVVFAVVIMLLAPLVGGGISLRVALSDNPFKGAFTSPDGFIFWQTRVPRVIAGFLVGGSLALSGLVYQAILRNPLAEPYVLGVSAGAAGGKALAVLLLPVGLASDAWATPGLCFVGGILPMIFLMKLASRPGQMDSFALLLCGIMLNIILSAAMMLVQVFARPAAARTMAWWWMGGLDAGGYQMILASLWILVPAMVYIVLRAPALNLLSLDPGAAAHLGVNVKRETSLLLFASTALAAASVALAGPIGFAGLLVPHGLRLLFGPDHRMTGLLAVPAGGAFLVACDLVGWRGIHWLTAWGVTALNPQEIPVGVVTALIGGPVFLWMLARNTRQRT